MTTTPIQLNPGEVIEIVPATIAIVENTSSTSIEWSSTVDAKRWHTFMAKEQIKVDFNFFIRSKSQEKIVIIVTK